MQEVSLQGKNFAMLLKRLIASRPHPFRLLLVLEWMLLGLSTLKLFGIPGWFLPWFHDLSNFTALEIFWLVCILTIFGIMGLRLPSSRLAKCLYIAIAIGLIAIATTFSYDSLWPFLVIVLLRSCLIFQRIGRWIIAGLLWLIYPLTLGPWVLLLWFAFNPKFIHNWRIPENLDFSPVITPEGGLQLALSPEQVELFLSYSRSFLLYILFDSSISFAFVLIFVLLSVNSLMNERQGRRKLVLAKEQLYQYSLQIEDQATLQERTRIAREIHDSRFYL